MYELIYYAVRYPHGEGLRDVPHKCYKQSMCQELSSTGSLVNTQASELLFRFRNLGKVHKYPEKTDKVYSKKRGRLRTGELHTEEKVKVKYSREVDGKSIKA